MRDTDWYRSQRKRANRVIRDIRRFRGKRTWEERVDDMARAFQALGVSAEEAAERLSELQEAFSRIGPIFPDFQSEEEEGSAAWYEDLIPGCVFTTLFFVFFVLSCAGLVWGFAEVARWVPAWVAPAFIPLWFLVWIFWHVLIIEPGFNAAICNAPEDVVSEMANRAGYSNTYPPGSLPYRVQEFFETLVRFGQNDAV